MSKNRKSGIAAKPETFADLSAAGDAFGAWLKRNERGRPTRAFFGSGQNSKTKKQKETQNGKNKNS